MAGAFPAPFAKAPPQTPLHRAPLHRAPLHRAPLHRDGAATDLAPADASAAASAALERCIARLEDVVDNETAALKSRTAVDLREFNDRKSQGLLDLSRSLRLFQGAAPGKAVMARLAGLRAKLDVNQAVLKLHLDAVREIATIMSDAIRDAESDGTYSPAICGVLKAYD
jgi:hypothetical protein